MFLLNMMDQFQLQLKKELKVANIIVSKKDEIIKKLPLYAAEDLKKVNFFKSLLTSLKLFDLGRCIKKNLFLLYLKV